MKSQRIWREAATLCASLIAPPMRLTNVFARHGDRAPRPALRFLIAALWLVGLVGADAAHATTVQIPAAADDCEIRSSTATTSYCGATSLAVGASSTSKRRSLLRFPVDSFVPRNVTVLSASVSLYATARSTTAGFEVRAYRPTQPWTSAATWNRYKSGTNWTVAGGDFGSTSEGSNPIVGSSLGRFSIDVTPIAQRWADKAIPNEGVLLKQTTEASPSNIVTLGSATAINTTQRPYLEITFDEPTPDPTPAELVYFAKQYPGGPDELWRSDATGSDRSYIDDRQAPTGGIFADPALSPDGRSIALAYGNNIAVESIDGTSFDVIYDGSAKTGAASQRPQWSPDGERVLFVGDVDANTSQTIRGHLYEASLDGGSPSEIFVNLPGSLNRIRDPSYSPDGRRIVFVAFTNTVKDGRIFTANRDGSNLQAIYADPAGSSGTTALRDTAFSPDGSAVLFGRLGAPQDLQVHSVGAEGVSTHQLTATSSSPGSNDGASWRPNGQSIAWTNYNYGSGQPLKVKVMDNDGSNPSALFPSVLHATWDPSFQQPGSSTARADRFRPYLLFDEGEKYRPLSVPDFFAEGQEICVGEVCDPITSVAQLASYPDADAELNVVIPPGVEQYQSPNSQCITTTLLDCDSGPLSKLYWHKVGPSTFGYTYYDYWAFYRLNDVSVGEHESDWESVSVAPSEDDQTFDFAAFSQHGTWYSYLRDNLRCDLGGEGSCGDQGDREGLHLSSFVSGGTHANYGEPCTGVCTQTNQPTPETQHGGEEPWGNNLNVESLVELPPTAERPIPETPESLEDAWANGPQSWTDWPGDWSRADQTIGGPAGKANREHFYTPWVNECADADDCPPEGLGAMSSRERFDVLGQCAPWFSPEVAVLACSDGMLGRALAREALDESGQLRLRIAGRRRGATAPGLAQLVSRPLRIGDSFVLRRPGEGQVQISVRVRSRGNAFTAHLPAKVAADAGSKRRLKVRVVGGRQLNDPPRLLLGNGRRVAAFRGLDR